MSIDDPHALCSRSTEPWNCVVGRSESLEIACNLAAWPCWPRNPMCLAQKVVTSRPALQEAVDRAAACSMPH